MSEKLLDKNALLKLKTYIDNALSTKQDGQIVDRTTGTKYKIIINNGIIGVEEVE